MKTTELYNELKNYLPNSTSLDRKKWANSIIQENLNLKELSSLLKCDKKIALRFQWLLSEIGFLKPNLLYKELPFLLKLSEEINQIDFKVAFATYWMITDVPPQNEAIAIELLFNWLLDSNTNVTTKSRSLNVLVKLTKKYPELKNELKTSLEEQIDKNTNDFARKGIKILENI